MNRAAIFAFGYAAVIISLSSIPGTSYPAVTILTYDKVIHFIEYAGFSFILARARPDQVSLMAIALFASLFGMGDELYQMMVPGRDSSLLDWIADSTGAVAGVYLYGFWRKRF